jgi:hypothetical protein
MEQKKFKNFRTVIVESYDVGSDKIRVESNSGQYIVYVNNDIVEVFNTRAAALKIAAETAKDIGTNK